jgi:adenosine kinase
MMQSQQNKVTDAREVSLGIISPDGRDGMLQHAREFHDAKIPFIFDPGQGLPMFDGEELMAFLKLADYCTVNDYEAKLLTERTGRTLEQLAVEVEALVVTLAGNGSHIYAAGRRIEIPVAPTEALIDPTGCGDAYRAGLLYGIGKGWEWEKTGRLASLMGSIKISHRGGQNHKLTRDDIAARYKAAFGDNLW